MPTDAAHALPEGFHSLTPHLVCADAPAAIDFYTRAFGAAEIMRLPGPDGRLWHAALKIGDSRLMLVDEMPEMGSFGPKGRPPVTIHLQVADVDAVYATALAAGAKPMMPPGDMFWGDRYGVLTDPFGHVWSIATRIRDMSVDELKSAGAAAMKASCAEAATRMDEVKRQAG